MQDNALQIFSFKDQDVRVVLIDGEPWWVAADVCRILEITNVSQAVASLDEDEKGICNVYTPGGNQKMKCVTEPGLYGLVLVSRKPEAKEFKRWLKHDVIPSIRKTGGYSLQQSSSLVNSLLIERMRLFRRHTKIPPIKFSTFEEIAMPFFQFEQEGYQLPDGAVPDISVGRCWCKYARETLLYDMSLVESYLHHYPDKRGAQWANVYPIEWLPEFRKWFYTIYLPENFPSYLKYLKASSHEIAHILQGFGINPQIQ